jgi:hypothetical protein
MKKLSSIGAIALAALVAGLTMLWFSSPAQAYPDVRIDLSVNRSVLYGGESFTATASSDGTTCCTAPAGTTRGPLVARPPGSARS